MRLLLPMLSSKTRDEEDEDEFNDDSNEIGKVEEIIRGGETSLDWDGVFARRVLLLVFGSTANIYA